MRQRFSNSPTRLPPKDARQEKCQEKPTKSPPLTRTGKASQQQADPASSATKANTRKGEGS
jgi:hypothetical protein